MAPRGAIRGILAGPDVPSPEGGNQPTLRAAGGRDARAGQGAGCGSWGRGGADASRAGGPGGRGELPTCLFGVGVAWVGMGGAGGVGVEACLWCERVGRVTARGLPGPGGGSRPCVWRRRPRGAGPGAADEPATRAQQKAP